MTIAQDLHARLRAVLLPEVPVLLPEARDTPNQAAPTDPQGRPKVGGGERGLGLYLQQHPQGYVQVEEPQGLLASLGGAAALWMAQVSCVATTGEQADALARAALVVVSRAGTRTTPYELTTPHSLRVISPDAVVATFILTARQGTGAP